MKTDNIIVDLIIDPLKYSTFFSYIANSSFRVTKCASILQNGAKSKITKQVSKDV
jgi:hypothetical protein